MYANSALLFALACGVIAVIYGFWARSSILAMDPGNARMQQLIIGRELLRQAQ